MKNSSLQSPLPTKFYTPPLVQPSWKIGDLKNALQDPVQNLEKKLCKEYGTKYCILLDSARSGIYLLSNALGIKGNWLTTSFNYRPTAVLMNNLISSLSFTDIQPDFTMDASSAEDAIKKSTEAIYVTHMFGKSADLTNLRKIADKHSLFLIENAVHLPHGIKIGNRIVGSWGDATLLSFNLDKPLGGLLGGALLTNRKDVWEKVKSFQLSNPKLSKVAERTSSSVIGHTLKPLLAPFINLLNSSNNDLIIETESFPMNYYRHYSPSKIHLLQAAVALARITESNANNLSRSENAEYLHTAINHSPYIQLPTSTINQPHSYTYYPIAFTKINRYSLASYYSKHGIETKWRYYPLHHQTDFKHCYSTCLDVTEKLWSRYLLLPIGQNITKKNLDYIARTTNDYVNILP